MHEMAYVIALPILLACVLRFIGKLVMMWKS